MQANLGYLSWMHFYLSNTLLIVTLLHASFSWQILTLNINCCLVLLNRFYFYLLSWLSMALLLMDTCFISIVHVVEMNLILLHKPDVLLFDYTCEYIRQVYEYPCLWQSIRENCFLLYCFRNIHLKVHKGNHCMFVGLKFITPNGCLWLEMEMASIQCCCYLLFWISFHMALDFWCFHFHFCFFLRWRIFNLHGFALSWMSIGLNRC